MHTGSLQSYPTLRPCGLWPARPFCQWGSPGKNTGVGCHTFLEHCVSCCPDCWLRWVSGAARAPVTQAAAAPPHLALPEANPSPPGQPQEQTPVHSPYAEVEIKPQLKPTGSAAKEEDPKPPTSYTSCRLNPHNQRGRDVYGIYKRAMRVLTKESALVLTAVDTGGKNAQE